MQKRILVVTQHFWPENFRINDMVEGFVRDGVAVDVLCGLPNYPKGNGLTVTAKRAPGKKRTKVRGSTALRKFPARATRVCGYF